MCFGIMCVRSMIINSCHCVGVMCLYTCGALSIYTRVRLASIINDYIIQMIYDGYTINNMII